MEFVASANRVYLFSNFFSSRM
ncbi:hypothetical protein Gotur_010097 [Gossypium turneri]